MTSDSVRTVHLAAVFILLGTFMGCSDLHLVEGVVLMDGKPLAGAVVYFQPDEGGAIGVDRTDQDGIFSLETAAGEGVQSGDYTVTLSRITDPVRSEMPPWVGTNTDVTPQMAAAWEAKMSVLRAKQREWVPKKYRQNSTTPFHFTVPTDEEVRLELESSEGGEAASPPGAGDE